MEHACHKCGANVEDGTPFCPKCGAPQIRVAGFGEAETPVGTSIPETPHAAVSAAAIEWSQAVLSSLVALSAATLLVLLGTPAGVAMLVAGFLSVLVYRRRSRVTNLTASTGAKLGALTGVLGFGVVAAILAALAAVRSGEQIRGFVLKLLQDYAARSSDPRVLQVMEMFKTPEGFTLLVILSLIMTLIAFLIFSSVGGAIGAALLYRKDRK